MKRVLFDTNAYAAFKRGDKSALAIVRLAEALAMSSVVIGELLSGFAAGRREAENRLELSAFLSSPRVTVLKVDLDTADYYARVYLLLRHKGRPIPTNDLWIAATALQHGFALFSFDGHFAEIDGLLTGRQESDFLP